MRKTEFEYFVINGSGGTIESVVGTCLGDAMHHALKHHPSYQRVTFWRPSFGPNPIGRLYPLEDFINIAAFPDEDLGANQHIVRCPVLKTVYIASRAYYEAEKEEWYPRGI